MPEKFLKFRLKTEGGFLYLEIIFATVLIVTGFLAVNKMFLQAVKTNMLAGSYFTAANIADQTMAQVAAGVQLPDKIKYEINKSEYIVSWQDEPAATQELTTRKVTVSWVEWGKKYELHLAALVTKKAIPHI